MKRNISMVLVLILSFLLNTSLLPVFAQEEIRREDRPVKVEDKDRDRDRSLQEDRRLRDQRIQEEKSLRDQRLQEERQLQDVKRQEEGGIKDRPLNEERRLRDQRIQDEKRLRDKQFQDERRLRDQRLQDEKRLQDIRRQEEGAIKDQRLEEELRTRDRLLDEERSLRDKRLREERQLIDRRLDEERKLRDRRIAEELDAKLKDKVRDERKHEVVKRLAREFSIINERHVRHFTIGLERIEGVLRRVEERANVIEDREKISLPDTRRAIATALDTIDAARSQLQAQAAKEYSVADIIAEEARLDEEIRTVKKQLEADLKELRNVFFRARDAVRNAAVTLAKEAGLEI